MAATDFVPLNGFRVLDLSQYLPGPYAAQILADLGAEVVKIEPPAGDPMRDIGPADADGVSAFYKLINAGKTVLRLDLGAAEGRVAAGDLIRRADVLLESFRPGALAGLGLGPGALRALNSRLIHCALSGFGQTGPYARRAGHDLNYMALGGGLATSGPRERPAIAYPPTADFAGAVQAALSVVAALLRRERTGQGAAIDVSLTESVLAWQGIVLTGALRPGFAPPRGGALLNGGAACYRIYETADRRFVSLGALEQKFWADFCRAIGRAEWIDRHGEPLPQSDLIAEVAALFRERPLAQWESCLGGIDCCFQAVLTPEEVLDHPQVRVRGLVRRSGTQDTLVEVLFPALVDGLPPRPRRPLREPTVEQILDGWRDP